MDKNDFMGLYEFMVEVAQGVAGRDAIIADLKKKLEAANAASKKAE